MRFISQLTPPARLDQIFAWFIISLLGNYTYTDTWSENNVCSRDNNINGDATFRTTLHNQVRLEPYYGSNRLHLPIQFTCKMNSLRIVRCGQRGLRGQAFEELVKVYDPWIWLLLFTFTFVVAGITKSVTTANSADESGRLKLLEAFKNWFLVLKSLCEQGDSLSVSVLNRQKVRLAFGLYLLVTIVLSNGYKSINVYNIIVNRAPLAYSTLDELIQDNFTIHTRVQNVRVGNVVYCKIIWQNMIFVQVLVPSKHSIMITVLKGECVILQSEAENAALEEFYANANSNAKNNFLLLKKYTGLHPVMRELIMASFKVNESVLVKASAMPDYEEDREGYMKHFNWKRAISESVYSNIFLEEINAILKSLNECTKVAAVIPEYVALTHARQLQTALATATYLLVVIHTRTTVWH